MQTQRLPAEPDAIAPDGSEVRILVQQARGSLAHFSLAPGRTSRAVRHRTVEELWYFVGGRGQMWRRDAEGHESVVDVEAGVSLDIPLGTAFQFRSTGDEPLAAVGTTMPPWPGDGEAVGADGIWDPA
jgi:mannose-6-phosphate isomerase-like protein (cupin superfamily)